MKNWRCKNCQEVVEGERKDIDYCRYCFHNEFEPLSADAAAESTDETSVERAPEATPIEAPATASGTTPETDATEEVNGAWKVQSDAISIKDTRADHLRIATETKDKDTTTRTMVALVGRPFSGKSAFFTSLFSTLASGRTPLCQRGWIMETNPVTEAYIQERIRELRRDHRLASTPVGAEARLYMCLKKSVRCWKLPLGSRVFHFRSTDMCGEALELSETRTEFLKNVSRSQGILYFLNSVALFPKAAVEHEDAAATGGPSVEAQRFIAFLSELRRAQGVSLRSRVRVPVAVLLSKCDLLKDAGIITDAHLEQAQLAARLKSQDGAMKYWDGFVRGLFEGRPHLSQVLSHCQDTLRRFRFFPVSSHGDARRRGARAVPRSFNVGSPVEWILGNV